MNTVLMTGAGVVSPAGVGTSFLPAPEGWSDWGDALLPDLQPSEYGWTGLGRHSRISKYAMLAIGESFRSAGVQVPLEAEERSDRTALVVYTCNSTLEPILSLYQDAVTYGVNHVNPGIFPDTVLNAIGGHASIYFRITGPNVTVSDTGSSAAAGLQYAFDLLQSGQADQVVCCAIHIHPPAKLRRLAAGSGGPESIVALLLRREDGPLSREAPANAVRIGWQGPFPEKPATFPFVPRMHSFLALASFYRLRASDRPSGMHASRFATSHPEGYYTYMPIGIAAGGERDA